MIQVLAHLPQHEIAIAPHAESRVGAQQDPLVPRIHNFSEFATHALPLRGRQSTPFGSKSVERESDVLAALASHGASILATENSHPERSEGFPGGLNRREILRRSAQDDIRRRR